jgi:hypothetical protein
VVMAVQEGVNKVGACMKTIVPEALLRSGAAAGTYPDRTSGHTGQYRAPKETARSAEALRADEGVACATTCNETCLIRLLAVVGRLAV